EPVSARSSKTIATARSRSSAGCCFLDTMSLNFPRSQGLQETRGGSYRFLRAVLNTAVRDGAIVKNPCQIPGAGSDRAKERPIATPAEVVALLESITPRYRAAVLLAAWCGLRRGEVLGLRPADVDLVAGTVTV